MQFFSLWDSSKHFVINSNVCTQNLYYPTILDCVHNIFYFTHVKCGPLDIYLDKAWSDFHRPGA